MAVKTKSHDHLKNLAGTENLIDYGIKKNNKLDYQCGARIATCTCLFV